MEVTFIQPDPWNPKMYIVWVLVLKVLTVC